MAGYAALPGLEEGVELRLAERGSGLVGRDRELEDLRAAMTLAVGGAGRLVLIGGEPGIGKSRLADELAGQARETGHTVLWGRGWEDAGAPPYWPWVQILRSYVRGSDPEDVRHLLGSRAPDVAQMLPDLRDLFPEVEVRPGSESDSARFQLFDSTATFLRNAAAARPMLVVLDDLQAADEPSILFLRFLASQITDMQLLVLGTYRDVALTPEHPLTAALVAVAREPATRLMTLSGLDLASLSDFIGDETGLMPDARAVAAVWRETKGNPLFVREAVRLLSAEGRLDSAAELPSLRIEVPAGVREVIARRIGHLSEETKHALVLGAVLGPEFSLDLLRAIDDGGSDDIAEDVAAAAASGLLTPITGTTGRVRFSHDLVRETLYDDLPPGRRAELHRRIADVLEEKEAAAPEQHLAELAFHFFEAARGDAAVANKAIDYATRAGEQATAALAYEEAARYYRMGLSLLDSIGEAHDEQRTDLLLSLGDAQTRAGDPTSRETFLEAADIARRIGAPSQLARAALGIGGRLVWARAGNDEKLIPALQDALVMLGGGDDRLRVRLLARLACALRSSPEHRDQSGALSRQAVELARRVDDPAVLSYALCGQYWATWWPENPEVRLPLAEEMLEVATAAGDAERMADAQIMMYLSRIDLGRMSEARRWLQGVARIAESAGGLTPWQRWLGLAPVSEVALVEGDYARAAELLNREAVYGFPAATSRDPVSAWSMQSFLLAREQGDVARVEEQVRSSIDEFPWYPCHRAALALLLIDLDRADEARVVFDDLAEGEFGALYRDSEWLFGMAQASEACALLDAKDEAAILYAQLRPFAGSHAIAHAEGSMGATDRYLGLLAETMGLLDEAVGHLEAGLRFNEQMGARPWAAHTQIDLARVLQARGTPDDVKRAGDLRRSAMATAKALGMLALEAAVARADEGGQESNEATLPTAGRFRREGEFWTVSYDGSTVRVRDAKGMRYLARLLADPGREFHALDLARNGVTSAAGGGVDEHGMAVGVIGDAGTRLDAEAKSAYLGRLQELQEEASEAEAWNDTERAARAQQEIAFLTDELKGAVGLGGRDRREASAAERARLSVTRAMRSAIGRIAEQHATLGHHLDATVRTGTFCSYQPDPRVPTAWEM
jgi:AAA ATPase domain